MKFKVYLLRAVLIFIALFIPSAITTARPLGGLGTLVLYAPFWFFIGAVLKGKVGPKLPPKPKNDSVPVTPEMLAFDASRIPPSPDESTDEDDTLSREAPPPDEDPEGGYPMEPAVSDALFYLCPQCGAPVSSEEYQCRCGCRLSPSLPTYRLCPACKRFIPQAQFKCDCGHVFPFYEQLLHTCPACGLVSPYEQRKCECGFCFPESQIYQKEDAEQLIEEDDLPPLEKPIGYIPVRQPQDDRPLFSSRRGKSTLPVWLIVCICLFFAMFLGITINSTELFTPTPASSSVKPSAIPTPPLAPRPSPSASFSFFPPPTSTPPLAPRSSPTPTSAPTPAPSVDLKPLPNPKNGEILVKPSFTSRFLSVDYGAPLTIDASSCPKTINYYIKLKRFDITYLAFFVRGGTTVDVEAPLGEYQLLYASGTDWYGTEELFGSTTKYYLADELFEFYEEDGYVNGWTVTLSKQYNGNLDVDEITAEEFD